MTALDFILVIVAICAILSGLLALVFAVLTFKASNQHKALWASTPVLMARSVEVQKRRDPFGPLDSDPYSPGDILILSGLVRNADNLEPGCRVRVIVPLGGNGAGYVRCRLRSLSYPGVEWVAQDEESYEAARIFRTEDSR